MSLPSIHQFAEKVALVSDASSPVGRAIAIQLALNGAFVLGMHPTGSGTSARWAAELAELGTLARSFGADGWTEAGARKAAEEVERTFGRLDILVNCLKFEPESSFQDITESGLSDTLMRNIGPAVFLPRSLTGLMAPRPRPTIVNVAATVEDAGDPLFAAAQAGLKDLTATLARVLPSSFRINGVEYLNGAGSGAEGEAIGPGRKRPTAPDDVARAVMFLLSSESKAVNGNILRLG